MAHVNLFLNPEYAGVALLGLPAHLVSEGEVHILEVPVSPVGGPVLVHRGVTVSTPYIQHILTVLVGAFVGDDVRGDTDGEGEQAGGVVRMRPHLPILYANIRIHV